MTILRLTTIHPNPGVKWEDVQKLTKKACDLARKHGAEDVTVMVTMIGGRATNTIGVTLSRRGLGAVRPGSAGAPGRS